MPLLARLAALVNILPLLRKNANIVLLAPTIPLLAKNLLRLANRVQQAPTLLQARLLAKHVLQAA